MSNDNDAKNPLINAEENAGASETAVDSEPTVGQDSANLEKDGDQEALTQAKKRRKFRRTQQEADELEKTARQVGKVRSGPGCLSRIIGIFGVLLGVGVIAAFILGLKYSTLFLPMEEAPREVVVGIPDGATVSRIGQVLEEAKVVRSADAFVLTVKAKNIINSKTGKPAVNLKAGEMALDPSLPVWKVIDLIAKGNYKLYPFTVPEGKNMFEIAKMIEAAGLGTAEDFLALSRDKNYIEFLGIKGDSLEGYLFPETYNFPKGTPLKTIIKSMTDSFFQVWKKYERLAREKGMTREEVVTLASIVEKETGAAQERPMIAGVFLNRLAKGMKLQTDPTVVYGIEDFDGNITKNHLVANHPYNTYVIVGLPPGPISNPGEAAISAVVKPDIVPYLYFVSKNDGTHHFSETLAEHNRMVRKYQRGGGQSASSAAKPKRR